MACSNCPCAHEAHDEYWPCPLFGGEPICDTCCLFEIEVMEEPFDGWTIEQMRTTCAECGKNKYEVEPFDG